jgi:hypothetical protein
MRLKVEIDLTGNGRAILLITTSLVGVAGFVCCKFSDCRKLSEVCELLETSPEREVSSNCDIICPLFERVRSFVSFLAAVLGFSAI